MGLLVRVIAMHVFGVFAPFGWLLLSLSLPLPFRWILFWSAFPLIYLLDYELARRDLLRRMRHLLTRDHRLR